ncbi:TPA: SP0191 family lipoprotein, partial [Streptococcus pneumoniae]
MKKIVLVSLAFLFVLVGCGQKKETGPATKTEKDTLQSALPVIENAEKNTVVTKTLVLPKSDDGSQQTQTITYKDKTFLSLAIQQKRPVSDELK